MAKKGNRVQVIMECTEHKNSGMPGMLGPNPTSAFGTPDHPTDRTFLTSTAPSRVTAAARP